MNKQTKRRHSKDKRPGFDPAAAPVLNLVAEGFTGKVVSLGEASGKPTKVMFTHPGRRQQVLRTFPRGLCVSLEEEFIASPLNMTFEQLLENGFRARVVELGEKGGKPTQVQFKKGEQAIVREFPRGLCEKLEQGFMMAQGVRVRPLPRRRL